MKAILRQLHNEETGMTLVEILAAIVILSIVAVSFLSFFIQGASTNQMTTEVNEATYIVQAELEELINMASNGELDVSDYPKEKDMDGYRVSTVVEIETLSDLDAEMYRAIVKVNEGGVQRAQMESWLPITDEKVKE